eukprot:PITA_29972
MKRKMFDLSEEELAKLKVILPLHHSDLFDKPQTYKPFIRSCSMKKKGEIKIGCVREVEVVTGLPAENSIERLEILDDENRVLSFGILGGKHRILHYRLVTSLHEFVRDGRPWTLVVESYVADVPQGNCKQETCLFIDTIVRRNLQSLSALFSRQLRNDHQRN